MGKPSVKRRSSRHEDYVRDQIVIDDKRGLVFSTEEELYDHFLPQIQALEKEYFSARANTDIQEKEFGDYESLLNQVLDDPDEVWEDAPNVQGSKVRTYVGHYTSDEDNESVYYVALAYVASDVPTFVYLHFPSRDLALVDKFRRGGLIYDRVLKEVEKGAIEGDALSEGDDLAVGLYRAMLKLRSEKDIPEEEFKKFGDKREATIEDADEIWRSVDLTGNILVTFIRDCPDESLPGLHYVVVTIEDTPSSSHALLFSFPTSDENLLDRYRHGENLQAEEVVQEASH